MLANINLLPQKERNRFPSILVWLIPIMILLLGSTWMAKHYYDNKKSIEAVQQDLAATQKLIQIEQNKAKGISGSNSASLLENLDQWLQSNRISTVKVLKTFTYYLPHDGYFISYQSAQGGDVNIQVQFDSLDQVSAYLYQLKNSAIVQNVVLSNVSTQNVQKDQPQDNSGLLTNTSTTPDQRDILPRYIAQFQIKLNVQEVRKDQKK